MNANYCFRALARGGGAALLLSLVFALPALAAEDVVLFDEAHGQRFTAAGKGDLDLSGLAGIIGEKGGKVGSLGTPVTAEALAGAKALVVSGPFVPFAAEEVAAIKEFLEDGGRLAVMLHIGPPVTGLFDMLHVVVSRGVVNELENIIGTNPLDFHVRQLEEHALTEGIESFAVYGSWALKNRDEKARVIARTGPKAWMDVNRSRRYEAGEPVESFGIVVTGEVGRGGFLVFSDDAIFQNRFLKENNRRLAENLAGWLLK